MSEPKSRWLQLWTAVSLGVALAGAELVLLRNAPSTLDDRLEVALLALVGAAGLCALCFALLASIRRASAPAAVAIFAACTYDLAAFPLVRPTIVLGVLLATALALWSPSRSWSFRSWVGPTACTLVGLAGAGVLLLTGSRATAPPPDREAPPDQPSVLLITVDTLRADFLGAYGRQEARTPFLDSLARNGYQFEDVVSPIYLTGPSHLSILSGLDPASHGVFDNSVRAPQTVEIVSDAASRAGLETAAFVAGFPVSEDALGLLHRFQTYDDDFRRIQALPRLFEHTQLGEAVRHVLRRTGLETSPVLRDAPAVTERAVDWFEHEERGPFFVWTHYYDPHLPFAPPREMLSEKALRFEGPDLSHWYQRSGEERQAILNRDVAEQMRRLYDAEIAATDREIGKLVDAARRAAGESPLWVIVTSDHGEPFGEHGHWFSRDLYEPTTRVPLIIAPPEPLDEARRVEDLVGLIDVAPTIADILGLRWRAPTDGRSLAPLLQDGALPEQARNIYLAARSPLASDRRIAAVRRGPYKAILRGEGWDGFYSATWTPERRELYHLRDDPGELHDLATSQSDLFQALIDQELRHFVRTAETGERTPEQTRALRSLGYLN